jgi:hypothetical protein
MELTAASRERVSAMPASSITTRVDGPMFAAHCGSCRWCSELVSLASVSQWVWIWSRSTAAAAAVGASPITVPPPCRHAVERACIAVVLPVPAGAIASCNRAPEVAISRTKAACPAFRVIPLAVTSSNAISTAAAVMVGRS